MKRYHRLMLGLMLSLCTMGASALPILSTLVAGSDPLVDDNVVGFHLTDTDGFSDDSNAFLFLENAGYAGTNDFGFYSWNDPSEMLTVFQGSDASGTSRTVSFALGGIATSTYGVATMDSYLFGLWLTSPEGTFYSDPLLNADGIDHFAIFNAEGSTGLAGLFDFVIGIEDQYGGGDLDYNDMVLGITDVEPYANQVPVAGTAALLPLGLIGMYGMRRRRVS
jgi:hypothetical protein